VYNIGSGRGCPIQWVLDTLVAMSTVKVEVREDPVRMRPADIPTLVCNPSRFYSHTGWRPEIPLEQTLHDILDYWHKVRTGEQALLREQPMLVEVDRTSKPYDDFQKWCREIVWWGNKKGAYLYSPTANEITPELAGHY
jgi:hypothetical protein